MKRAEKSSNKSHRYTTRKGGWGEKVSTGKRMVNIKKRGSPVLQDALPILSRSPPAPERGRWQEEKGKNAEFLPKITQTQIKTPQTCPVPQMSGPITQTRPHTERAGSAGQNPQKPSPNRPKKKNRNIPSRKKPDPNTRKTSKCPQRSGKMYYCVCWAIYW